MNKFLFRHVATIQCIHLYSPRNMVAQANKIAAKIRQWTLQFMKSNELYQQNERCTVEWTDTVNSSRDRSRDNEQGRRLYNRRHAAFTQRQKCRNSV